MTPGTATAVAPPATKPLRDVRGLWRVLLAVIAPLPMLAKGIFYLLTPAEGSDSFKDTVAAFAAREQLVGALKWFDAVFVAGLVPATFAVAWAARRGAPRLTTAGAVISLLGFLAGCTLLGGVETPALQASPCCACATTSSTYRPRVASPKSDAPGSALPVTMPSPQPEGWGTGHSRGGTAG